MKRDMTGVTINKRKGGLGVKGKKHAPRQNVALDASADRFTPAGSGIKFGGSFDGKGSSYPGK